MLLCRNRGSREEDTIQSSVLRYTVRREEEIGARLSNKPLMYSTGLVGNDVKHMSAMHLCIGTQGRRQKERLRSRGERSLRSSKPCSSLRRERSGRKGGRRNTRCDVAVYRVRAEDEELVKGNVSHAPYACSGQKSFIIKGRQVLLRTEVCGNVRFFAGFMSAERIE